MGSKRLMVGYVMFGLTVAMLGGCDLGSSGASPQGRASQAVSSATISWLAPDTNANGSALTDLAGYRIYYGTSAAALQMQVDIPTPGLTDYVIENLVPGTTYYFAMSTYNSNGVESAQSPVVALGTS